MKASVFILCLILQATLIFCYKSYADSTVTGQEYKSNINKPIGSRVLDSNDISIPDDASSFKVNDLYDIHFAFEDAATPPSILMVVKFHLPNMYFALGFGTMMGGSDMWIFEFISGEIVAGDYIGGYYSGVSQDTSMGGANDLTLLGYEATSTYSLVKFRRALDTGDSNDAVIYQGHMDMMYAYANTPTVSYHGGNQGLFQAPFVSGVDEVPIQVEIKAGTYKTYKTHAILVLVAWGILVDIGIIILRLFKGRTVGKVPTLLIHSLLMWCVLILSLAGTALVIKDNQGKEKQEGDDSSREDQGSQGMTKEVHKVLGIIMIPLVILTQFSGITNITNIKAARPLAKINFKIIHICLAILTFLVGKVNIILGCLFYRNGEWRVPVYIYLLLLLVVHIVVQAINISLHRNTNPMKTLKAKKRAIRPQHLELLQALNQGVPKEKIMKEFSKLKWMTIGNKVYDLTGWIHPGGNFIIEECVGRDVGRYFYGNHKLESFSKDPHKHSSVAVAELNTLCIGEIKTSESILVRKSFEAPAENDTSFGFISSSVAAWTVSSIRRISPTVSQVNFTSEHYGVRNFGTSLSWLGQAFTVAFDDSRSAARLYTTALSLTETNFRLRAALYNHFQQVLSNPKATFSFDTAGYFTPQSDLPLFIKRYPKKGALSAAIHNIDCNSPKNKFHIEGPHGQGLKLSGGAFGSHVFVCGGTGVLPFLDFLNLFLWKNMYDIIKKRVGAEKAEEINILRIPFDTIMNDLKITFVGTFPNQEEALGLDIIQKLAEISSIHKRDNFKAMIRGVSAGHIQTIPVRLSKQFFSEYVDLKDSSFQIVGSPSMNAEIPEMLVKLGVEKNRIVLV